MAGGYQAISKMDSDTEPKLGSVHLDFLKGQNLPLRAKPDAPLRFALFEPICCFILPSIIPLSLM